MNTFEALVALNLIPGIGSVRLSRLLEYFSSPEDVFGSSFNILINLGIPEKIAQNIISFKKETLEAEIFSSRKIGAQIITFFDANYPENLKKIPGAPLVLYCLGNILQTDKASIAIVGSRTPSVYGISSTSRFSAQLCQQGITIVSGLARGIDTYAHRAALKTGGRTIAVLGSGVNQIYPPENIKLAKEISVQGAVISEFPVNTLPLAQNFPRRNRIISGLALGVLVAEAAKNSGALITADFALEQGREVFALPGKIDSVTSFGTNNLIKQGAKLVVATQDMLEELFLPLQNLKNTPVSLDVPAKNLLFDKDQSRLYHCISGAAVAIDELVEKTKFSPAQLSSLLLKLQLSNLIKELPGKHFMRN